MEKIYVVYSHGKVKKGYNIDQVIQNIAAATGKDTDRIKKQLLSGKKVKVKSFGSLQTALHLENMLDEAGLKVSLVNRSPQTITVTHSHLTVMPEKIRQQHPTATIKAKPKNTVINTSESSSSAKKTKAPQPSSKFKWFGIAAAGLFTLGLLGTYAAYHWFSHNETPQNIASLERALLLDNRVSLISTFDVKQLRKLIKLKGFVDSEKTTLPSSNPIIKSLMPYQALSSSNSLSTNTDFIIASLNLEPDQIQYLASVEDNSQSGNINPPQWFFILSGQYDHEKALNSLRNHFEVESFSRSQYKLTRKNTASKQDHSCPDDQNYSQFDGSLITHIDKDYIVFSESSETLNEFIDRLTSQEKTAKETHQKIAHWRDFRKDRLFAASMINQELIKTNLIANGAHRSLLKNSELDTFQLSVDAAALERSLNLAINIGSPDKSALAQASASIVNGLKDIQQAAKDNFPTISKLTQRITAEHDEMLTITAKFDQELTSEFASLVNEGAAYMFSGLNISSADNNTGEITERLIDQPWNYSLNPLLINKSPYQLDQFEQFNPVYQGDGFALFLESITFGSPKTFSSLKTKNANTSSKQTDPLLAISFELKQRLPKELEPHFFNLSESGGTREFFISDILNNKGKSLIRDERCLEENIIGGNNHETIAQFNGSNNVLSGRKTIRLKQGSTVNDIQTVKGWYRLKVPTKVRKEQLSMNRRSFSWGISNSFRLANINGNEVQYNMTGDTDNIIAVRALNSKKQELAKSSSFSSKYSASQKFHGKPAYIDVYIAEKWHDKTDEFEFTFKQPEARNINQVIFSEDTNLYLMTPEVQESFNQAFDINSLTESDKKLITQQLGWQQVTLDQSEKHEIGSASTQRAWLGFKHDNTSTWNNRLEATVLIPFKPVLLSNYNAISAELTTNNRPARPAKISITKSTTNGVLSPTFSLNESASLQSVRLSLDLEKTEKRVRSLSGKLRYRLPISVNTVKIPIKQLSETASNNGNDIGVTLIAQNFIWNKGSYFSLSGETDKLIKAVLTDTTGKRYIGESNPENGKQLIFTTLNKPDFIELYFANDEAIIEEPFELIPAYK